MFNLKKNKDAVVPLANMHVIGTSRDFTEARYTQGLPQDSRRRRFVLRRHVLVLRIEDVSKCIVLR